MAPTASGQGYWLFAADGGIFAFGDARFYGSTGGIHLNQPVVALVATSTNRPGPQDRGYWLVGSDGGVFAYSAPFVGSLGSAVLSEPIAQMVPPPSGSGYWLIAKDGTPYNFTGPTSSLPAVTTTAAPSGGTAPSTPPVYAMLYAPASRGDKAVYWALGQLGKPYQWGAAGPMAFDCSGLTLKAWQAAGVTIPRVANDQYDLLPHVPLDQLIPGDLVFFATDTTNSRTVHHVGIYLGNHQMLDAPDTGAVVRPDPISGPELMGFGARPAN
jgi:cell wall-associated NlpC family hydrolase